LLIAWKEQHSAWVDSLGAEETFHDEPGLASVIQEILNENHVHFLQYGPRSKIAENNPASTAQAIWSARILDTLVPNNTRIMGILQANTELLSKELKAEAILFKMHAAAFEANQYSRTEEYPQFPTSFSDKIKELAK